MQTLLTEQRQLPRFKTDFPAMVESPSGELLRAKVTNLSLSGVQLTGDHRLTAAVLPNVHRHDHHEPIGIGITFEVPTSGRAKTPIQLSCHVVYTRRQARGLFTIGCCFVSFANHCEAHLQNYIENFGIPIN